MPAMPPASTSRAWPTFELQQPIGPDAFGAAPTLLNSKLARRRFTVASLRYARRALRNQCARKVLAPRVFKLGEHFIVPHSGHNKMLRVPSFNRSWFDHHPALRRRRSAGSAPFGSLHAARWACLAGIQTVVASPEVADAGYAAGIDLECRPT